ncbi:conserved hypothetical protein [Aeropyrum pernix]|uniref:DUF711 domain-containing protein n=1 Tax=Aeropyrum pernix TaxID=56636 RepID=A0A401H820_AERPX|nr:DUF711 family protein [Aeropyrum pernix]GBF08595.1 conserved hypothetical protein [Aeropyrum pernix]
MEQPGFKLRAVTIHFEASADVDSIEDAVFKAKETIDRLTAERGVEVWSLRAVLTPGESVTDSLGRVAELEPLVEEEGVFINLGLHNASADDLEAVSGIVESGFFLSFALENGTWEEARSYSELLHRLADKSPDLAVHIGFNPLGTRILTPYFPLATSPGEQRAVTVALLYPRYLLESFRKGGLQAVIDSMVDAAQLSREYGKAVARDVEGSFAGVDLSISPWMEESSLALVEEVGGVRLPEPGFAYGLRLVNEAIAEAASRTGDAIGFNEVQLPVAEDSKLKVRVAELETSARDLLRLSGVCLAGLDMAVIPASLDGVAGLLLEARAYSRAKGSIVGVRLIPLDGVEPGDEVFLKRFGEVPVIPI